MQWNPSVKAKRIKGLHELALAKLGVTSSDETTAVPLAKKDEMYHVDSPNRNHPTKAAPENESAGVRVAARERWSVGGRVGGTS